MVEKVTRVSGTQIVPIATPWIRLFSIKVSGIDS
jgi:hypothetical protein